MVILAITKDRKVIASASVTQTVPIPGGNIPVLVRVADLRSVEYVVQYKFDTDPLVDIGSPVNEKIEANVVGLTLAGVAAGTTLTTTITCLGF